VFGYRSLGKYGDEDLILTLVLVDSDQICRLHLQFFDDPSPTDVITFPLGDDGHLGDIVICVSVARQQAHEAGHSLGREIAFLALHGLLHLSGHDDRDADARAAMLQLQERILLDFESGRQIT
jgi:probable rRNA maturation factor